MPAFEAIPVLLPQSHTEFLRLELVAMITGNCLAVSTAELFIRHEFPPDELAYASVSELNRAMRRVRDSGW